MQGARIHTPMEARKQMSKKQEIKCKGEMPATKCKTKKAAREASKIQEGKQATK